MGWQEQRDRAKQFKQQTDTALANDILQDTLFSRTKVIQRHSYQCIPEENCALPDVGTEVRIIDMQDRIDVYSGNIPVGHVHPSQADLMREHEQLAERKGRSVRGRVTKVSKLIDRFSVEVTD